MAGQGPAPKDPAQRRRRNKDPNPRRQVAEDGELRGIELPAAADIGLEEGWHPMTRRWWGNWRASPQAQTFLATDWDFLLDTALMHHTMWSKGRWEFASELRLRVSKFGATAEDRQRLRMDVTPSGKPASDAARTAKVTDIASRRRRLTS